MKTLTPTELVNFEKEIFSLYEKGKIKGVIHLSGSVDGKYEKELVKLFKEIKTSDWVFSGHRNHYHILLKAGKRFCKKNIMNSESMHQYSYKHKVFTSGIVAGCVPIALGTALANKLKGNKSHVWCFVGDMGSQMGTFHVCAKYAGNHNLPITFVIENNNIAVYTPTGETWPYRTLPAFKNWIMLNYKRKYPHHGIGKFVHF